MSKADLWVATGEVKEFHSVCIRCHRKASVGAKIYADQCVCIMSHPSEHIYKFADSN